MKFNSKKTKGDWFEFTYKEKDENENVLNEETVKLLIKPFSNFTIQMTPGDEHAMFGNENIVRIIDYCLVDWENIFDSDGNKLKCNKENKLMVIESIPEILEFIIEKSQTLRESIHIKEEVLKN